MQIYERRQSKSSLPPCPTLETIAEKIPSLEMNDAFSWGALIFTTNCRRLLHVYAGVPEIFATKHISNPYKVADTVAGIVYPGADNGLDEHHCFCRIRRALLRIPETKVLWTTAARMFEDAAREEISLLREHSCCPELIDYRLAFDSLMSIVFDKEIAYNTPDEYRKLIETKCDKLIASRIALYSRYEADEHSKEATSTPSPEVSAQLEAKLDANLQAVKKLDGKIDCTGKIVVNKISRTIAESREVIVSHLPSSPVGRPPKTPRKIRGPKNTALMQLQRKKITSYLLVELHKTPQEVRPEDCLHVWNLPENQPYWNECGKLHDRRRGYENFIALHRAYRYWEIYKKRSVK